MQRRRRKGRNRRKREVVADAVEEGAGDAGSRHEDAARRKITMQVGAAKARTTKAKDEEEVADAVEGVEEAIEGAEIAETLPETTKGEMWGSEMRNRTCETPIRKWQPTQ